MQTKIFRALNATLNPNTVPECGRFRRLSDEFWGCLARHYTQTIYHPAGTTKMGPKNDPMAVVDSELQVYGIKHLRVVDCSIMPTISTGNTNVPVMMIAEKASDMIKSKYLTDNSNNVNRYDQNYGPEYRREDFYNREFDERGNSVDDLSNKNQFNGFRESGRDDYDKLIDSSLNAV